MEQTQANENQFATCSHLKMGEEGGASMPPPAFQLTASSPSPPEDPGLFKGLKLGAGRQLASMEKPGVSSEGNGGKEIEPDREEETDRSNEKLDSKIETENPKDPPEAPESPEKPAKKKKPKKIKVKHFTKFVAPNGSSNKRTTVGVGEEVDFKSNQEGTWSVSNGTIVSGEVGEEMHWQAPDTPGTSEISIKVGTETHKTTFTVLAPNNITATKLLEIPFLAGTSAAGMFLQFNYNPMSVSFGNVESKEVSGPATNITGYFAGHGASALWHNSGDKFLAINSDNTDSVPDEAAAGPLPAPWSAGTFEWIIPNHYRVKGTSGDHFFTHVTQAFEMQADGTLTITKAGESVTRTP